MTVLHTTASQLKNIQRRICDHIHLFDEPKEEAQLFLDQSYQTLHQLLREAEEDLTFIADQIDQDPECRDKNPLRRLNALSDYLNITSALYDTP